MHQKRADSSGTRIGACIADMETWHAQRINSKRMQHVLDTIARCRDEDVQRHAQQLLPLLAALPSSAFRQRHTPTLVLQKLATAVNAHPALMQGLQAQPQLAQRLDDAILALARDSSVYEDGRQIVQLASAQALLQRYCNTFWRRVAGVDWAVLQAPEVAMLVHRAARLHADVSAPRPSPAFWAACEDSLVAQRHGLQPRDVANVMWALATLAWQPGDQLQGALRMQLEHAAPAMRAQELAVTVWAVARLGMSSDKHLMVRCCRAIAEHCTRFEPRHVAQVLWALAEAGAVLPADQGLRRLLMQAVVRTAHDLTSQGLSMVLRALSKMFVVLHEEEQFALLAAAEARAPSMTQQELAATHVALTKLQVDAPGLRLQTATQAHADAMTAQSAANTLWAYARAQVRLPDAVYSTLYAAALRCSSSMNLQEASVCLWAHARTAAVVHAELVDALCLVILRDAAQLTGKDVACTLWALTSFVDTLDEDMEAVLLPAVLRTADTFGPHETANVLHSVARLRVPAEPHTALWDVLTGAVERTGRAMRPLERSLVHEALQRLQWPVTKKMQEALPDVRPP